MANTLTIGSWIDHGRYFPHTPIVEIPTWRCPCGTVHMVTRPVCHACQRTEPAAYRAAVAAL